jgi:transcriptional regulator with XRE-family HTH domain
VKETVAEFYDKIYQNRHEMQLVPAKEEIINRKELAERLDITEPTIIRWERKKSRLSGSDQLSAITGRQ